MIVSSPGVAINCSARTTVVALIWSVEFLACACPLRGTAEPCLRAAVSLRSSVPRYDAALSPDAAGNVVVHRRLHCRRTLLVVRLMFSLLTIEDGIFEVKTELSTFA